MSFTKKPRGYEFEISRSGTVVLTITSMPHYRSLRLSSLSGNEFEFEMADLDDVIQVLQDIRDSSFHLAKKE